MHFTFYRVSLYSVQGAPRILRYNMTLYVHSLAIAILFVKRFRCEYVQMDTFTSGYAMLATLLLNALNTCI